MVSNCPGQPKAWLGYPGWRSPSLNDLGHPTSVSPLHLFHAGLLPLPLDGVQEPPSAHAFPHLLPGVGGHVQHLHLAVSLCPLVATNPKQPPLHNGQVVVGPWHQHVRQGSLWCHLHSSTSAAHPTHLHTRPLHPHGADHAPPPCSWTEYLNSIGRTHPIT